MKSFGLLLGLAFADLAVAGLMAARGDRGIALLFLLLAIVTAAFAVFGGPSLRRDPRGRLQPVEPPYSKFLGTFGAAAILVAAAYVATTTTRGREPKPTPVATLPQPVRAAPAWTPPPSQPRPTPRSARLLYKCEDARGHASFQSQACAPGTRQVWVREVMPEAEPPRSRRTQAPAAGDTRMAAPVYSFGQQPPNRSGEGSPACQAARAADAAYRRRPLSQVTHAGLRRHGDAIQAACK